MRRGKAIEVGNGGVLIVQFPEATKHDIGKTVDLYEPGSEPVYLDPGQDGADAKGLRVYICGLTVGEAHELQWCSPEYFKGCTVRVQFVGSGKTEDVHLVRWSELEQCQRQHTEDNRMLRVTIDKLRGLLSDAIDRLANTREE